MTETKTLNGWCKVCGERFIGMTREEWEKNVSRHIWNDHRDQDPDEVIVEQH